MDYLRLLVPSGVPGVCSRLDVPALSSATFICAALAIPHFLYAWIWFRPKAWQRIFGHASVEVFALCGHLGKVIQAEAILFWVWASRTNGLCGTYAITLPHFLAGLLLGAFGQILNAGIYHAIGKAGVYYGFKLGHKIPWAYGFPFNMVAHPQYVGSVCTVWALYILFHSLAPQPEAFWLALYWSLLYLVTAIKEQYFA